MVTSLDNDFESIETRNALRRAAHLPLLDAEAEAARLAAVRGQAEVQRERARRRPEFSEWIKRGGGWISKMGLYCIPRRQVRNEMREGRNGLRRPPSRPFTICSCRK